jgi:predicted O-methyltransferase YrrM
MWEHGDGTIQTLCNVAVNSLKRRNLTVMAQKAMLRLREHNHLHDQDQATKWCATQAVSWPGFASTIDTSLWRETEDVCSEIHENATEKLENLGLDLGGGGHYPLLYFMARHMKPHAVVETGVAAGWSSKALLLALRENNAGGKLFSSDFPYFRLKNPERYVGSIVDDNLKEHWTLLIEGDRYNLPLIAKRSGTIDLFHYDSDKSYSGRAFALQCLEPKLSATVAILFDDIQNNFHFKDLVAARQWTFKVFAFEGKYVGLTGPFMQKGTYVKDT